MNSLQVVERENQRVLTTKQIAEQYGTQSKVISNNFNRNKTRYTQGKHFYCIEGKQLKEFKLTNPQIDESLNRVNKFYLWTEKGALLHAKSLNTDKAWQAYEYLIDFYFRGKHEQQPSTQKLYKGVPVVTVRDIVNHTGIPKSLIRTALKNCTLNKDYWLLKSVELLSFRQDYPEYRIAKHLFVIAESGVKKLANALKFKPNALVTTTVPTVEVREYPETMELVPKVDYDAFLNDLRATKIYIDILGESKIVNMYLLDNVYKKHGVKMDIPVVSNPFGRVKCALEEIQRVIIDYPELCFVKTIENDLKRKSNITENASKFPLINQLERNFIGGLLNFKLNTIESIS